MSDTLITPVERRSLAERGMTTVEYALGVVVVIVLIGVIVTAIQTGTFRELIEALIGAIAKWITGAFNVPIPSFFGKP